MSDENEDLQDIPTLTDVVKAGNPSLIFNLSPPPSSEETEEDTEHETEIEPETENETEVEAEIDTDEAIEEAPPEFHHLAQTMVIDEPPTPPPGYLDELNQAGSTQTNGIGIDLAELGLPDDFFKESVSESLEETSNGEPTLPVSSAGEQEGATLSGADINPESLLMQLEAPVSDILQRHIEMAREEILSLIREEVARQINDNEASSD
jgi:hypothetical protein